MNVLILYLAMKVFASININNFPFHFPTSTIGPDMSTIPGQENLRLKAYHTYCTDNTEGRFTATSLPTLLINFLSV